MADITFGTVPLIVLTFQGYCVIRNLLTEYKSLYSKLPRVLGNIGIAASLFKTAVNKLLEDFTDEDTRKRMLEDPNSEHWTHDLGNELERILGTEGQLVRLCIDRTRGTLEDVKKVLYKMCDSKINPTEVGSPVALLAQGAVSLTTAVLQNDPLELHLGSIRIKPIRRGFMALIKNHRGELEWLLNELRSQNNELLAIIKLVTESRSGSRASRPARLHQASLAPSAAGEFCDIARACRNSRAVQRSSQSLYRIISQALLCDCHSTHLCLDKQAKQTLDTNDPKGKSKHPSQPPQQPQSAELSPRFSFQLMIKSHNLQTSLPNIPESTRIIFEDCIIQTTDPASQDSTSMQRICEELLSWNEGYQKHLRDTTTTENSGFLLWRAACSGPSANRHSCVPILSLEKLIVSRATDLHRSDRFSIAANLALSLIHFYCSPWVSDWSLQTIHYFERQEAVKEMGLWTPHLSLDCNRDLQQFGVKNREIHSLGLILLQLGSKRLLEITKTEEEEIVLERALQGLYSDMGSDYVNFVRNCLYSWSERTVDLLKDENLNTFLSYVNRLEELARLCTSK